MSRLLTPVLVGVLLLTLVGCTGQVEETPAPDLESIAPLISVTGKVLPAQRSTLSTQSSGIVAEVLVEPGDRVAAGDVLVRLDATDATLALRQAEAVLHSAQAQLALLEGGARAEEVAVSEAQIEAAGALLSQAVAEKGQFEAGTLEADIAAAEAQLAAVQAEQRAALEAHDQTMKCYDVTLPDGQTKNVCPALGTLEEQARFNLHAADQAVAAAQARLDALVGSVQDRERTVSSAVWAAAAQRNVAQAQLALLEAGPRAEEIAVAEAAVEQALVTRDSTQVALDRCQIHAPFDGTIGAVNVRLGEFASVGQALVTLGDLNTLRIETTDLDEIDVAQVAQGQEVAVTLDALPDRTFVGHVVRISPMSEPGAGGVNYTTYVELSETVPEMRWGMTAFVDIQTTR
ncbi:MAG: HlyD family efflux transporter periplasmic adaptor subunit [Chloroflexi bacterium]|nr:HlyD family efflux transporter periplasmic adaptor subunit [Chloroflexota bacterium]